MKWSAVLFVLLLPALLANGQEKKKKNYSPEAVARLSVWSNGFGSAPRLVFSPDDQELITVTLEGSEGYVPPLRIWIWDIATKEKVRMFPPVPTAIAVSPDGKLLLIATKDSVRLCDLNNGRTLREFKTNVRVGAVGFAPDGDSFATGRDDGDIHLWETGTLKEIGKLSGHTAAIIYLVYSQDGRTIASVSADGSARLWQPHQLNMKGQAIHGHDGSVHSIAITPDSRMIATSGADKTVRVWERASRRERWRFDGNGGQIAISPDGKLLASGHKAMVHIWDLSSGKLLRKLEGHLPTDPSREENYRVSGVRFSHNGKILATSTPDMHNTIMLWDVSAVKPE